MTTLDPKLLHQLSEVVQQGSLSRAAANLKLTQPTLSRNIKIIEQIVGSPVLHRGRYGVTPTKLGERLAEHGKNIEDTMMKASDSLRNWQSGIENEVRIGVGDMLSASLIPAYLKNTSVMNANYTLHIGTDNVDGLKQKLRDKKIDIALMPETGYESPQSLTVQHLYSDKICVVAGTNSPLCHLQGKIDTNLLGDQEWISIEHLSRIHQFHNEVQRKLNIEHVVPKLRFNGDITAPWRLLRHSNMLSLVPRRLAELFVSTEGIKILDIDADIPRRNLAMWMLNTVEHENSVLEVANSLYGHLHETTGEDICVFESAATKILEPVT